MDTKTGEMQKMTSDSEKISREKIKEIFKEKITHANELANEYYLKAETVESRNESSTMKAFYVSVYIAKSQHSETLELLGCFMDALLDLKENLRVEISNLDKTIEDTVKKTGVELLNMRTRFGEMKKAIDAPIYKYVKTQQASDEKRKKLEEELLDWVVRSR
jgi:predicted  nucleic acid-binding Zn-ribbon protein